MAIYSELFPLKMVIFHSYISLPKDLVVSKFIVTIKHPYIVSF